MESDAGGTYASESGDGVKDGVHVEAFVDSDVGSVADLFDSATTEFPLLPLLLPFLLFGFLLVDFLSTLMSLLPTLIPSLFANALAAPSASL